MYPGGSALGASAASGGSASGGLHLGGIWGGLHPGGLHREGVCLEGSAQTPRSAYSGEGLGGWADPPVNKMTHRCKNITLSQTKECHISVRGETLYLTMLSAVTPTQ